MAPLDLILPRVSCAAAGRASAAAMTANRMRFMFETPVGIGSCGKNSTLVVQAGSRVAHPLGDRGEEGHAEGRVGLHQVEEDLPVDGEQGAVGLGVGVGGARTLIDQRHLAEYSAGPD